MSYHEYLASQELSDTDPPFYALVMAAMRKADSRNIALLREAFPETWAELDARYNAPGGRLPHEYVTGASDQTPTEMADWPAGPPGELAEAFGK